MITLQQTSQQLLTPQKNSYPPSQRSYRHLSPHFFALRAGATLQDAFQHTHSLAIELCPMRNIASLLTSLNTLDYGIADFTLSLTTATCYQHNTALYLSQLLQTRLDLTNEKMLDVRTCLQEALLNAIFHGNLGLKHTLDSASEFEKYEATIKQRLSMEHYKHRRLTVRMWESYNNFTLSVSDEGDGFCIPSFLPEQNQPYGRGLLFIKSLTSRMWVGHDRRTLHMVFPY